MNQSKIRSKFVYVGELCLEAVLSCDGRHNEALFQKVRIAIEQLETIRRELEDDYSRSIITRI